MRMMFMLVQEFQPDGFFDHSIFKNSNKFVKSKGQFFKRLKYDSFYRSIFDAILAMVLPEVKPLIVSYYSNETIKRANDVFSEKQISTLDKVILHVVKSMFQSSTMDIDGVKDTLEELRYSF